MAKSKEKTDNPHDTPAVPLPLRHKRAVAATASAASTVPFESCTCNGNWALKDSVLNAVREGHLVQRHGAVKTSIPDGPAELAIDAMPHAVGFLALLYGGSPLGLLAIAVRVCQPFNWPVPRSGL